jgi:hypothetical protein
VISYQQRVQENPHKRKKSNAHLTNAGLWIPERNHTPFESDDLAECIDCLEERCTKDDYCRGCSEPLCEECQQIVADEPLCAKCFAASQKAAIESLQNDPDIGQIFQKAA